jgi:hypothetical protein
MHFGFMNVILLYINHQLILATQAAILRVVSTHIQIVCWDHSTIKIVLQFMAIFFCLYNFNLWCVSGAIV